MNTLLSTQRLRLRPLRPADAPRIQMLCGNWNVARMLEVVPYPYPDGLAEDWIAGRAAAWRDGNAYTFAIDHDATLIGIIGLERKDDGNYGLGYWLGEPWWGQGLMSEAVTVIIAFAHADLGLAMLVSGYFDDNPTSGRILRKHGFRFTHCGYMPCKSRGCEVAATFMALHLNERSETSVAP